MPRDERAVYLTFDDGPIPEATPWVLSVLRSYGIKATFFMVGDNVDKHPDVFRQVIADGHRIGNHTHNHVGGFRFPSDVYLENARLAHHTMEAHLQALHGLGSSAQRLDLFRPPHGWMRPMQYKVIHRGRYRIIMWDVVTRDYSTWLNAEEVFGIVRRYTRPGSIITFHDSLRSIDKLHSILPSALEWLLAEGYGFRVFD